MNEDISPAGKPAVPVLPVGDALQFKLHLSDPTLESIGLPVEVSYPEDLTLVRRALTTDTITGLAPRVYMVRVKLPAGQILQRLVEVTANAEPVPIELAPSDVDRSPHATEAQTHYLKRPTVITSKNTPSTSANQETGGEARLRFWRGNALIGKATRIPVTDAVAQQETLSTGCLRITLKPQPEPLFLQIARPGLPSSLLGLPTWNKAGSIVIQWEKAGSNSGGTTDIPVIAVDIHVPDVATDVMFHYRLASDLTLAQAALNAVKLPLLLGQEPDNTGDAVSAAIAGYGYLRFNRTDEAKKVAEWLTENFPTFPDGFAILAEHRNRVNAAQESLNALLRLPDCGLPLFMQGLSLVGERLEAFVGVSDDDWRLLGREKKEATQLLRQRIRSYISLTDFRRLPLTFTGATPNDACNEPTLNEPILSPLTPTEEICVFAPVTIPQNASDSILTESNPLFEIAYLPITETINSTIASDNPDLQQNDPAGSEEMTEAETTNTPDLLETTSTVIASPDQLQPGDELLARLNETQKRFDTRKQERDTTKEKIKAAEEGKGRLQDVETDQTRKILRKDRLLKNPMITETPTLETLSIVEPDDLFERILGGSNLLNAAFLDLGARTARTVGRIQIGTPMISLIGYGTGSMISPRILMTNNHVLPDTISAGNSRVEFDYSMDADFQQRPSHVFKLRPDLFFITDKALDFTLVAVEDTASDGTSLAIYGFNRLTTDQGKINLGEAINIIQHPSGQLKQIALQENKLLDRLDNYLHYEADTTPGSSGSPLFNNQWEVIGLHHSGTPKRDAQGNILADNGQIWTKTMGEDHIQWESNEGIRISRILEAAKQMGQAFSDSQKILLSSILTPPAPGVSPNENQVINTASDPGSTPISSPAPVVPAANIPSLPQSVTPTNTTVPLTPIGNSGASEETVATFTIPVEISVRIGGAVIRGSTGGKETISPAVTPLPAMDTNLVLPGELEKISIDPDYSTRKGYDTNFLGTPVPMPILSASQKADAAVNRNPQPGDDPLLLKYHHFSIMMCRSRRLAYFTAVNIDGTQAQSPRREKDVWILDPRIGKDEQVPGGFYAGNDFDQGHLVRRLDPAWGDNEFVVKTANDDTFHYANCSPQHKNFNQGKTLWAGLEDFLLNGAKAKGQKITVFTGPIFLPNDPVYRGIRVPLAFWKVVAFGNVQGGGMTSGAFLVSQKQLVEDMLQEGFTASLFQVPVRQIAQMTGLDFGNLPNFDPLNAQAPASPEVHEAAGIFSPGHPIGIWQEVRL